LVIIESVLIVPQAGATNGVHRISDGQKVLKELAGNVLENGGVERRERERIEINHTS
jgi:hypothetical protein